MRSLLRLSLFVFCGLTLADYRSNIYTENAYVGHSETASSHLRARAGTEIVERFSTFVQFGQELFTTSGGRPTLDLTSSYAYAGPGFQWSLGKFQVYGEGRIRKFYSALSVNTAPPPTIDARLLAVYGDSDHRRLAPHSSLSIFQETYTEAVFTSADAANLIMSGFFRGGLRAAIAASLNCDLFLEPFLTIDRIGHFYNNRAELRPSVRLQYWSEGVGIGLIGSYTFHYYFPLQTREPNAYSRFANGIRILATAGVTL